MAEDYLLRQLLPAGELAISGESGPVTAEAMGEADRLYQAQKWPEAAKAYEAITKAEPDNGRAWYRFGISLHKSERFEQAIAAYQQAIEKTTGQIKLFAMYNVAASYARLNDKEKAFEWLNKLISAGLPFPLAQPIKTDPDLASLRGDARFKELLVTVDKLMQPCMYSQRAREFDFWVGEWNVQNPQGQQVGVSSIQRIEQGCVILENWTGGQGGTGKSLNFYDASLHKWRQTWADSFGGVSEFAGEYRDGAMRFEGESHAPDGTKIMRRLTFFNLGPDRVRQFSEASQDNGKTWTVDYDFTYVRRHN